MKCLLSVTYRNNDIIVLVMKDLKFAELLYNAAVNVFLDPPHRGEASGLLWDLPGGLLFVQAPGV